MVEKLLKCPNCGANATNHQNCEYCGSLLVRFVDKGIDLSQTTYLTNENVIPGLIENLKKNLEWQSTPQGCNCTEISLTDDGYKRLGMDDYYLPRIDVDWENGFCISLYLWEEVFIKKELSDLNEEQKGILLQQRNNFKQLKSFSLFSCDSDGEGANYSINFGKDVDGAARLISEIVLNVFQYQLSEIEIATFQDIDDCNRRKWSIGADGIGVEEEFTYIHSSNDDGLLSWLYNEEGEIATWVWWVGAAILFALIKACS